MDVTAQIKALKSAIDAIINMYNHNQTPKIIWHALPGKKLKATWEPEYQGHTYGLKESDMDPIQEWCYQNLPGSKRLSFDTFIFANDQQITIFLLRWA